MRCYRRVANFAHDFRDGEALCMLLLRIGAARASVRVRCGDTQPCPPPAPELAASGTAQQLARQRDPYSRRELSVKACTEELAPPVPPPLVRGILEDREPWACDVNAALCARLAMTHSALVARGLGVAERASVRELKHVRIAPSSRRSRSVSRTVCVRACPCTCGP